MCVILIDIQMLSSIEEDLGPLTTLVNNAGVGVIHPGDPLEVTSESFDRCMSVNARLFPLSGFPKLLLVETESEIFPQLLTLPRQMQLQSLFPGLNIALQSSSVDDF